MRREGAKGLWWVVKNIQSRDHEDGSGSIATKAVGDKEAR